MDFDLTEKEYDSILDFKRDLHMYPELPGKEFRTTEKIREFVKRIPDMEILELPVETGLVTRMSGSGEGPEIMLRADIDALPQTEAYESPWKSRKEGVMHACGHDFHTASLLGAMMILNRAKKQGVLKGKVDFVFQPAEEGTRGARMLIDAGLFERIHPDYCFGIHNWPSVPSGQIICHRGALMSSKRNFEVRIFGSGGHGSMPHLNADPIVCAAAVIQSLQTVISRNTNPLDSSILSINMIEGGSAVNMVVENVRMLGTVRSLSQEALERAVGRIESIVKNTAAAYECGHEILWKENIPFVWNSDSMTEMAERCAKATGYPVTDTQPSLASEDFSLYASHVPSFFYWVGSHKPGEAVEQLHRPRFHTDDEAMKTAAKLYAMSVLQADVS